jgi:hypothetical protein
VLRLHCRRLIFFRVLQGLTGGGLQPLVDSVTAAQGSRRPLWDGAAAHRHARFCRVMGVVFLLMTPFLPLLRFAKRVLLKMLQR